MTAYEMLISDWGSDVCPSDLPSGQAQAWPQASHGHASDDAAAGPEPALEPRLRQRHADQRPAHPHPCGSRRLYARVPRPGGRHPAVRRSEERSVGKECVSTGRVWLAQDHSKKKIKLAYKT